MSNFKMNLLKNTKGFQRNFCEIKKPVLRSILQGTVSCIENKTYSPDVLKTVYQKLITNGNQIDIEYFAQTFAGIFIIVQSYMNLTKGSIKDDELRETLKEIKFSDESIEDILKVLLYHRDLLQTNLYEMRLIKNSPKNVEWRLNISFLESGISGRLSQPTIVLHIFLGNLQYKTVEMTVAMFHRLRYNIACLLKEMQVLENRQIMKK